MDSLPLTTPAVQPTRVGQVDDQIIGGNKRASLAFNTSYVSPIPRSLWKPN